MSRVMTYDIFDLASDGPIVPGSLVSHASDPGSLGTCVIMELPTGERLFASCAVLWSKEPDLSNIGMSWTKDDSMPRSDEELIAMIDHGIVRNLDDLQRFDPTVKGFTIERDDPKRITFQRYHVDEVRSYVNHAGKFMR